MFNFQNEESLKQFKDFTNNTDEFSRCFNFEKSMAENSNKFFKTLDDALHRCFNKIRIKTKSIKQVPCEIQTELDLVTKLKGCIQDTKCKLGKQICISQITTLMEDRNISLVNQQISQLSSTNGNFKQV